MTDFKKIMGQFGFVKSNRSNIERLLKIRLQVIFMDLVALQKSILYGFVLVGMAVVFFFISLLGIFFGLNDIVVDSKMRIWLFFGGSAFFIIAFFIFFRWAIGQLTSSAKTLSTSIKEFRSEIDFVLGKDGPEQISRRLEDKIEKQLEQMS